MSLVIVGRKEGYCPMLICDACLKVIEKAEDGHILYFPELADEQAWPGEQNAFMVHMAHNGPCSRRLEAMIREHVGGGRVTLVMSNPIPAVLSDLLHNIKYDARAAKEQADWLREI